MAKEDTRTSPSYKITCALPFTEQDEVTFQHGKIWELSTKKCAQSTADKRRVRLMSSLPHKNEVSAWSIHCALCKAKAFSTPEKPPLAVARIVPGGRFFLPFISEKLHCSEDSCFSFSQLNIWGCKCYLVSASKLQQNCLQHTEKLLLRSFAPELGGKKKKKRVRANEKGNLCLIFSSSIRQCK